jgi:hypothetical protein
MYTIVQHTDSDRWCIVSEFGHTVAFSLTFATALERLLFHYSQQTNN